MEVVAEVAAAVAAAPAAGYGKRARLEQDARPDRVELLYSAIAHCQMQPAMFLENGPTWFSQNSRDLTATLAPCSHDPQKRHQHMRHFLRVMLGKC